MKTYKSKLPEFTIKYKKGQIQNCKITSSKDCHQFFKMLFDADTIDYYETAIMLLLNRAHNTIGWYKISHGGVAGTVIDPKVMYNIAITSGATSVILAHNHPSGNLEPSGADLRLTNRLKKGFELLEIPLLDHLIITSDSYTSMADTGKM